MNRKGICWRLPVVFAFLAMFFTLAQAQDYPKRPVSLVVPFSPGGVTDIVARMLADSMAKELGQAVIVENVPGAGGDIAYIKVARAVPDGYTLLLASTSTVTNPALRAEKRFDPVKNYSAIGYIGAIPFWLLVNPGVPGPASVAELVQQAHSAPAQLNYGSGGVGTASHLGLEFFKSQEQIEILHVPYKGQSDAVTGLMAGTVKMVFMPTSGTDEFVRAKKLKALATTSRARLPGFPDVPTFAEAGYPAMTVGGWLGMVAPAGTPAETIAKLSKVLNKILAQPDFKSRLAQQGLEPRAMEPAEFARYIEREVARWNDVIARAGIKVD